MIPRTQDILGVLPELSWCGFGVFLMLLQPFLKNRQALTFFAMFGAALGTLSTFFAGNRVGFGGLVAFDTVLAPSGRPGLVGAQRVVALAG